MRARLDKRDGWFRFCRPYLEELDPRHDLDLPAYASGLVARARDCNADPLVMLADDGGYPLYPSARAPINPHVQERDLLGMIERECRRQGLRFGLGFLGVHCNSHIAATQPTWAMRDEAGKVFPFYQWHLMCLNSPYGRYYIDLIEEALTRYRVDYLYVEGGYFRPKGCFCAFCKERFEAAFGKELGHATPLERRAFAETSLTAFQSALKAAADAASPETVVVGTSYAISKAYPLGEFFTGCDVAAFSRHTDMVAMENQWGISGGYARLGLRCAGFDILQLKTLSRKPVVGTWWASHDVDGNYHQRSPAHARLTFMETLAYGAAVQPHIQSVFEFERSLTPILAELFSCVERVREYLLDATPMPYLAVVDGARAIGYCNALIERHLPFDLLAPGEVDRARLAAHRAVIVSEAASLTERAVGDIDAYVRSGGGLLCAGRIGGSLAALAGIELADEFDSGRRGLPLYYRFDTDAEPWCAWRGRLLSFRHPCVRVCPSADCRIEADLIALDPERMHPDHMGIKPYPGAPQGPMVVTRRVNGGRVVYLAGDLVRHAMPGTIADADAPVILAEAARWAAGAPPPLATAAPPSVELVAHVKRDRMAIFVLNQTTNQVEANGVIRYVIPLSGLEVRVRASAPVRSVAACSGQPARHEVRGGWLTIRLAELREYEVLLIDFEACGVQQPGNRERRTAACPPQRRGRT